MTSFKDFKSQSNSAFLPFTFDGEDKNKKKVIFKFIYPTVRQFAEWEDAYLRDGTGKLTVVGEAKFSAVALFYLTQVDNKPFINDGTANLDDFIEEYLSLNKNHYLCFFGSKLSQYLILNCFDDAVKKWEWSFQDQQKK